jgi:hypothetical protein
MNSYNLSENNIPHVFDIITDEGLIITEADLVADMKEPDYDPSIDGATLGEYKRKVISGKPAGMIIVYIRKIGRAYALLAHNEKGTYALISNCIGDIKVLPDKYREFLAAKMYKESLKGIYR